MDVQIRAQNLKKYDRYVDLFYTHIASIKQDKKTRKCTRAEYAKELVKKHRELLKDTLNKPKRSALVTREDKNLVAKKNWQQLSFMNPWRIILSQEATLRALEAYRIPLEGMSGFTVIHKRHETSDVIFKSDAALLNAGKVVGVNFDNIRRKFQSGLQGYNYIAMIEFAIFENEPLREDDSDFERGFLIAPHLQGIIWKDGGIRQSDLNHFKGQFTGGRWKSVPFKHEPVWDVTGSVSYMHKLPLFAYKKSYKHESVPLSQDTAFLMFERLKYVSMEDMFISGGEGQNVRAVILNYLRGPVS